MNNAIEEQSGVLNGNKDDDGHNETFFGTKQEVIGDQNHTQTWSNDIRTTTSIT